MRLTRLLEDLDDKDTFEANCYYCDDQRNAKIPDMNEFHEAHTTARQAAEKAGKYGTQEYKNAYEYVMYQLGYRYHGASLNTYWVKVAPLKEDIDDIDDEDEFEAEPEIDIDEYIVEYWGMSACSFVMLSGAKEYGWVPKSSGRWEQFEDIKMQFPDLYEAAVEVARESIG